MQHSDMIVEEIVSTLEKVIGQIGRRLDALEAETGVEIVRDMDPDRTDYRKGTLASIGGGGLQQWTGTSWHTVLNGVESVKVEGDTLVVERSDGTVQRSAIKKTARSKPVKVAA
ncbi:hypothetical protein VW23_001245 [Devosia insulae DS-56]|uniref:Uncharacterized protein n=1 Tax=Devosia insulae DS-56 TaxID=1116389 RepID=A0A1E5XQN4_9HYPH|nr:hypothetical protein [Devosia insulae]OEO30900.1 hypothetical protein VW23_001245 [Devosia insulae DS-56]